MAIRPLHLNKRAGFTLVEVLVYTAGLVLLLGAMATSLVYMNNWYQRSTIGPRVDRVGSSVIDRIVRDIRSGDAINGSQSLLEVSTGALSLSYTSESGSGTTYSALQSGRVIHRIDSGSTEYLSPEDMTVSRLYFKQIITQESRAVRVEMDITFSIKDEVQTRTYSSVAILRNSYE
ncbi:MAG: hypothetical protein RLY66_29 [Candidatus Parcubacteria bacterium]|jgi:hypothetical protein